MLARFVTGLDGFYSCLKIDPVGFFGSGRKAAACAMELL
jgi:hypothetical protein